VTSATQLHGATPQRRDLSQLAGAARQFDGRSTSAGIPGGAFLEDALRTIGIYTQPGPAGQAPMGMSPEAIRASIAEANRKIALYTDFFAAMATLGIAPMTEAEFAARNIPGIPSMAQAFATDAQTDNVTTLVEAYLEVFRAVGVTPARGR
jgi:hypothetical protein